MPGKEWAGFSSHRVTQGKGWPTISCCRSGHSAAAAPVPFPPPSPPGAGRSGCCCGHVAAVPRSGAREALRNLLLLHKGCVDVPGRPLRALCAATQRRPFPLETSPGVAPGPGCLRPWSSDAGTAEGLVTKATCSQLTPEPEGDGSRWQQESLMAKQGMSWDKSGT